MLLDVKHLIGLERFAFADRVFRLDSEVVRTLLLNIINGKKTFSNVLRHCRPISKTN